jgi:prepilin-type processing-associated H-X9-DG protein
MEENFVGYLLDALDERTKLQVEAYLETHPDARAKLATLKQGVNVLEADLDAPAPPPLLAERTLARVAEHVCAGDRIAELPKAPPATPAMVRAGRSRWRRPDVLVAACLLLMVTGISVIVLYRMQVPSSEARIEECKNNLREFFGGLQAYRDRTGHFPDIVKEAPHDVAGMVVPILAEAGVLPSSASIRCPAVGSPLSCDLTLARLREMKDADFKPRSPCLSMCYAYSLGYRDEEGVWHTPGDAQDNDLSQTPIMADRPPSEGIVKNSVNHGGAGQNVLFADGHLEFLPGRKLGADDDIFLNSDNRVAAGRGARDIVLGFSAARP